MRRTNLSILVPILVPSTSALALPLPDASLERFPAYAAPASECAKSPISPYAAALQGYSPALSFCNTAFPLTTEVCTVVSATATHFASTLTVTRMSPNAASPTITSDGLTMMTTTTTSALPSPPPPASVIASSRLAQLEAMACATSRTGKDGAAKFARASTACRCIQPNPTCTTSTSTLWATNKATRTVTVYAAASPPMTTTSMASTVTGFAKDKVVKTTTI